MPQTDTSELRTLKSFTVKIEGETVDRFNRLREDAGVATNGQFFTDLLDRFEMPQKVADRTADLQEQLSAAEGRYEAEHAINETLRAELAKLRTDLDAATQRANENADLANAQQLAFQKQLDERPKLEEGQVVVSFRPDCLRVLDYVCERESRKRGQRWTRSHVVNFFIWARFIKGQLNGNLGAVSDAELRRLGVKIENKIEL